MAGSFSQHFVSISVTRLDTIFLVTHLLMTRIQKQFLVEEVQLVFTTALVMMSLILMLKVFYRSLYNRWRPPLVFICHLVFTTLRAAAVHSMANKMAVLWRVNMFDKKDGALTFLIGVLTCLGGPFRLFEMLGLQQPFTSHVIISLYYIVIHSAAVMKGARLAYSNALFYVVHEVYDALAAVVDGLLSSLLPLPSRHQATCSSCPGVALYVCMLLYGSVAMPLYVSYNVEVSARRRFYKRLAAAGAAQQQQQQRQRQEQEQTAGSSSSSAAQQQQPPPQQQQQQCEPLQEGGQPTASQAQQQWHAVITAADGSEQELLLVTLPSDRPSSLTTWSVHVLVLLAMLLLCWMIANAIALVLLPKVLTSEQLVLWCPNRPYVPYVMAGEVYPAL